ncbi:BC85_0335 family putative methyltransferase [Mycoplasmopsis lipofaciens]|uniref:BC85_0335 family putative methyltransferase n=1 Tax=Mycoplasmopsis lipofaciens TaxID=114884 RepID=UPI000482FDC4|nr:hypothetical protein [Mycoplasmopsis lipofaciens]
MNWIRTSLIISMVVVILIAMIVYLILFLKTKKLRKIINDEQQRQAHEAILAIRGEELGKMPFELKKYLKNKSDDHDLENLINTIYLNKAQNVLLLGKNINYELVVLLTQTNANIYVYKNSLNIKTWNSAVLEFPNLFTKTPIFIDNTSIANQTFDLIYDWDSDLTCLELLSQNQTYLKEKGMFVALVNSIKKQDIKTTSKILKNQQVIYEISYVKNQFLYVVKNKNILLSKNS